MGPAGARAALAARGAGWRRSAAGGLPPRDTALPLQHDQWHVLHTCATLQARLERRLQDLQARSAVVARQAARVAAGQKPKGRNPQTDVTAHAALVAQGTRVSDDVRYLLQEVHRLLEVVVLDRRGVLDGGQRQADLTAALTLVAEVAATAPATFQREVQRMYRVLQDALASLLTFVDHVAQIQQDLRPVLPAEQQALLGWAWLRRKVLGWRRSRGAGRRGRASCWRHGTRPIWRG